MATRGGWEALMDLPFPRYCVACGNWAGEGPLRFLCSPCVSRLFLIERPVCPVCGFPYYGRGQIERTCPQCLQLKPRFDRGRSLLLHREAGAELVRTLKYRQGSYMIGDLVLLFGLQPDIADVVRDTVLVPVPLHAERQRSRGFNQSMVIARALSRAFGCEVQQPLVRQRRTTTQTALGAAARRRNVKNAFALAKGARIDADKSITLVDDVFTTGATLDACAAVLRSAGVPDIRFVTLAHG